MDLYLIFSLNSKKMALPIAVVDRVVRVVATRSVENASPHLLGVLDLEGSAIPAINLRTLLGQPEKTSRII